MKLGDMMKAYRAEHKYTLRDFAEVCGISFAQVRLMEKGENTHGGQLTPSIKSLKAVAKGCVDYALMTDTICTNAGTAVT